MTIDTTYLEKDLENIIADEPVNIVHYGDEFTGFKGTESQGAETGWGGYSISKQFSIGAKVSDFTTTPEPKQPINVNGEVFIISEVRKSSDGVQYVLLAEEERVQA